MVAAVTKTTSAAMETEAEGADATEEAVAGVTKKTSAAEGADAAEEAEAVAAATKKTSADAEAVAEGADATEEEAEAVAAATKKTSAAMEAVAAATRGRRRRKEHVVREGGGRASRSPHVFPLHPSCLLLSLFFPLFLFCKICARQDNLNSKPLRFESMFRIQAVEMS